MFVSIQELVALATSQNKSISEVMIEQEMEMTQQSREFIWAKMEKNLQTMKNAVKEVYRVREYSLQQDYPEGML